MARSGVFGPGRQRLGGPQNRAIWPRMRHFAPAPCGAEVAAGPEAAQVSPATTTPAIVDRDGPAGRRTGPLQFAAGSRAVRLHAHEEHAMTDDRFQEIEKLIEDADRCFDPVTGLFESISGAEEDPDVDADLDPPSFLGALGITAEECAEYVQRKMREYDEAFRDA